MKTILAVLTLAIIAFALASAFAPSADRRSAAVLTVVSSKDGEVVTFAAAYVSGDSTSSSALTYSILKTPFRLEISSPLFLGIFKKVSGEADMIIRAEHPTGKSEVSVSSSVVLMKRRADRFSSEAF